MPTWNEINSEIDAIGSADACDQTRQKYIQNLQTRVERNVIAYYSGFLQKRLPDGRVHPETAITDLDMNGMMAVVHNMDRGKGLDLILHTPGGGVEAGRAIVEYLFKKFRKRYPGNSSTYGYVSGHNDSVRGITSDLGQALMFRAD